MSSVFLAFLKKRSFYLGKLIPDWQGRLSDAVLFSEFQHHERALAISEKKI